MSQPQREQEIKRWEKEKKLRQTERGKKGIVDHLPETEEEYNKILSDARKLHSLPAAPVMALLAPEAEAEENVNDSAASVEEDSTSSETVDASQGDETKQKVANAMKSAGLSAVRMFAKIDQTSDGFVSRRELRTAISGILKGNVKMKDIDAMMTTFDANGDGVISLDEFLGEMEEKQSFVPKLPDLAPPPKKK